MAGKKERIGGGGLEELDVLKEIIKSNPSLYDKVIQRMRQLRIQNRQSIGDYLKEKEINGSSDRLDARKRNYSK
ncbi:MAG: hypothetical protein ACOH5I_03820 [Oligoflexus sp.]